MQVMKPHGHMGEQEEEWGEEEGKDEDEEEHAPSHPCHTRTDFSLMTHPSAFAPFLAYDSPECVCVIPHFP